MMPRYALLLLALLCLPLTAEVRDLKAFFQERCAVCHGADGSGRSPGGQRFGGRNLTDTRWLAKQDELALVTSVLKGRGAMPGFRRQLSEAEVKRLLKDLIHPAEGRKNPSRPLQAENLAP